MEKQYRHYARNCYSDTACGLRCYLHGSVSWETVTCPKCLEVRLTPAAPDAHSTESSDTSEQSGKLE
jgi:hypothetical protein